MDIFTHAQQVVQKVGERLALPQDIIDIIKEPEKVISLTLDLKRDDGSHQAIRAYRSQHNSKLGPYKGGFRITPEVTEEEVKALSLWMSIKNSVVDLPYGGGKGGIQVQPKEYSPEEIERLVRAYARGIAVDIGEDADIPAPDVNTNAYIIDIMVDEYEKVTGKNGKTTFTGKSLENHGLDGRTEATGLGGYYALKKVHEYYFQDIASEDISLAVQGIGNVGYFFSSFASDDGYTIKAISDSTSAVLKAEKDLDIDQLLSCKKEKGSLQQCDGTLSSDELLTLDVDILVPSAVEDVITEKNMRDIKARYILELANGPVNSVAYDYLTSQGVVIIPDVLANTGGVIGSYLEWMQNKEQTHYSREENFTYIKQKMDKAFDEMQQVAQQHQVDLKTSAYMMAIKRIAEKYVVPSA